VIRNAGLGEFLRSRRARLDPAQAGLTSAAGRRVPRQRREELAGVSKDYYTRLEQGRQVAPSGAVLEALAAALCSVHNWELCACRAVGLVLLRATQKSISSPR
jgi:transcriptional regulator with XRE-family HTH domain